MEQHIWVDLHLCDIFVWFTEVVIFRLNDFVLKQKDYFIHGLDGSKKGRRESCFLEVCFSMSASGPT